MPVLPDLKKSIFTEEVDRNKAVAQSTWRKIGGAINFLNNRTHEVKRFDILGAYGGLPLSQYPFIFVDGAHVFEYDAEIFNIWVVSNRSAVGAGQTEIDIKLAPAGSEVYSSILTTTAKIQTASPLTKRFKIGDVSAGIVAPVMTSNPLNVAAGDAIRADLITAMSGMTGTLSIIIHFRPR
jgi:hypothetical protein